MPQSPKHLDVEKPLSVLIFLFLGHFCMYIARRGRSASMSLACFACVVWTCAVSQSTQREAATTMLTSDPTGGHLRCLIEPLLHTHVSCLASQQVILNVGVLGNNCRRSASPPPLYDSLTGQCHSSRFLHMLPICRCYDNTVVVHGIHAWIPPRVLPGIYVSK